MTSQWGRYSFLQIYANRLLPPSIPGNQNHQPIYSLYSHDKSLAWLITLWCMHLPNVKMLKKNTFNVLVMVVFFGKSSPETIDFPMTIMGFSLSPVGFPAMLIPMVSTFGAASTTGIKATSSTSMKLTCRRKWGIDFPVKWPLKWGKWWEKWWNNDGINLIIISL